jgi:cytochrome c-type biogenesis protein CcmH
MISNDTTRREHIEKILVLSWMIIWTAMLMASVFAASSQDSTRSAAQSANGTNPRPVSAEEVKKIAGKLMAPCCWSQTADVHTSDTAKEMQAQIRAALQQGYNEKQIVAAFVAEYGERILAKPKASGFNLMVWILPGVALAAGGLVYWRFVQRARAIPAPKPKRITRADESYSERFERELAASE